MEAEADRMLSDTVQRNPHDEVIPGVVWGRPEWLPSAAYWAERAAGADSEADGYVEKNASLEEVLGFCILGGYGVTYELNQAAHDHLLDHGVYEWASDPTRHDAETRVEELLRQPIDVNGRKVRYRFPRQRSVRLVEALRAVETNPPPTDNPRLFRDHMMRIRGIGPKTASWIARNLLGATTVAILDIHVVRAGRLIGLFNEEHRLPRDYGKMENRFLEFADAIGACPSLLDAIMWQTMRSIRIQAA